MQMGSVASAATASSRRRRTGCARYTANRTGRARGAAGGISPVQANSVSDNAIQCLRRAIVDIDATDASLSTGVEIEEPQRLIGQFGCDGDRLDGNIASIASISETRVKSMQTGVREVQENARVSKTGLGGGVIALREIEHDDIVQICKNLGWLKY